MNDISVRAAMKAMIINVGTFNEDGRPVDWSFDHAIAPHTPALNLQDDGSVVWSGYTLEELREVARRDARDS